MVSKQGEKDSAPDSGLGGGLPKVPEVESIDLGGGGFIEVDGQGVPLVISRPKPRGLLPVPPEVEATIAKKEARLLGEQGIVPTPGPGMPGSGVGAAEGRAEAHRAMEWLRQAIAGGYRKPTVLQTDSDLDPLRSRPDFQLLMMDLEFPYDPFARGH
jgi:hypothetical protein